MNSRRWDCSPCRTVFFVCFSVFSDVDLSVHRRSDSLIVYTVFLEPCAFGRHTQSYPLFFLQFFSV